MLRLSTHAGPLKAMSRFNRLDWVEIGYETLNRHADYKVVLFEVGRGAREQVALRGYPRWSGSIWDLVVRSIALALSPDPRQPQELAQPVQWGKKKFAFVEAMSAVIQHIPNAGGGIRQLASMELTYDESAAGAYRVTIEEEMLATKELASFIFAPEFLRPAELVMRAALVGLTGSMDELPSRPLLYKPTPEIIKLRPHVRVDNIREPARSGFRRWLIQRRKETKGSAVDPVGTVPYPLFEDFLDKAV
jgi:hypothetical protein